MKQSTKIRKIALSLAAAATIAGSVILGFAAPQGDGDAHAALKWSEHVVKWNIQENNGHDNNKDGLKFVDPTPTPSTDATTTP